MKTIISILFCLFLSIYSLPLTAQNAQWVDPFIGTDKSDEFTKWGNYGGTFPGAVAPWGMVQLSPETSIRPMEVGYYYSDTTITSFSCHSHRSGYPNGSNGNLHLSFWPSSTVSTHDLQKGRTFSHTTEKARAGYYTVTFPENDRIEMTASAHNGFFRYHSKATKTTLVVTKGGKLTQIDRNTLQASQKHSILRFSQPMRSCKIQNDTAFISFQQTDTEKGLNIWLSVSATSFQKSQENAKQEIKRWDFDQIQKQTYQCWNDELACIQVEGGKKADKTQLYTALYHACLVPNIISDVTDKECAYEHFSPWDTFRSLHPMLSLLKPERQQSMMDFLIKQYQQTGELPKGPMTGFHLIPIFLDALKTNATQLSPTLLLEASIALLNAHEQHPLQQEMYQMYHTQGYLSANQEKSVSITSELAYNDWALSEIASLANDPQTAKKYADRALNYRHLFDAESGFLLPRQGDAFFRNTGELGYQESDRWTSSYFVPHNMQDLINRMGGDERFANRLANDFSAGKILFDNEPVFHYPYLFTWANRPDLTVAHVHQILERQFHPTPGGITGNDDLGSMSSWYVLSAIGLYPACPGSGEYFLSTPLFDQVELHIRQHTFTIQKKGDVAKNQLPTLLLDGKKHNLWFITHQALMNHQSILYDGTQPHQDFASLQKPMSLTQETPRFEAEIQSPVHTIIQSGTENQLPFQVKNTGESGLFVAQLHEGNHMIAEKTLLVESGTTATDTLCFTAYSSGTHSLQICGKTFPLEVRDSANRKQPFTCLQIEAPSLALQGKPLTCTISIQNIAGKPYQRTLPILVNQTHKQNVEVNLQPGETQDYTVSLHELSEGMNEIEILQKKHHVKVYQQATDACLLWLEYSPDQIKDQSGFENQAIAHGKLTQGENFIQTDVQAYLTLPASKSLMSPTKELTLLTWIAPQPNQQKLGYADFFTKGDYTCLKMEGPNTLVFFAGGWGRGTCEVKIPSDWYKGWHLVAGVCTGSTIQLYIDGELKQEIAVQGELTETEVPWNIGRNAEMPFSRFWKAKMAKTRIYGAALSPEEIQKIYNEEK